MNLGIVNPLWTFVALLGLVAIHSAVAALAASHVAGLRGHDRLHGFKTGLLFGVVGVMIVAYRKSPVPDVAVTCPHCGTIQDVGGDLTSFECCKCEERSQVLQAPYLQWLVACRPSRAQH